jgi:hypothetical protein
MLQTGLYAKLLKLIRSAVKPAMEMAYWFDYRK